MIGQISKLQDTEVMNSDLVDSNRGNEETRKHTFKFVQKKGKRKFVKFTRRRAMSPPTDSRS